MIWPKIQFTNERRKSPDRRSLSQRPHECLALRPLLTACMQILCALVTSTDQNAMRLQQSLTLFWSAKGPLEPQTTDS